MHILILPFRDYMKFSNSTWIKSALLFSGLLVGFSMEVAAQSDLGSPYSVLGPGIPIPRQGISQATMGGTGAAMYDLHRINLINPAAAAFHSEPIFEAAAIGQLSEFSTNDGQFNNQQMLLNNLSLAFPIKRGVWNLNMGLVPLTRVSYNFVVQETNEDVGPTKSEYSGQGGISQAYLGLAHKIFQRLDTAGNVTALAGGVQLNYNFGPIDNVRRLSFPNDFTALGLTARESYLVRDLSLEFGLQYHTNIIKRTVTSARLLRLSLGGVYRMGNDLSTERSNYVYNWRTSAGGNEVPRDTIFQSTRSAGYIHMPQTIIIGSGLDYVSSSRKRIRLALDYAIQNWSQHVQFFDGQLQEYDFNNAQRVSVGIEFTPTIGSSKFFEQIDYRVGYRYVQTGINISNTDIDDYGISFGLSLPVNSRRNLSQSRFSIGAEYGSYGTIENGLVREEYVRIMAGFSLTPHFRNRWFVKPKYD